MEKRPCELVEINLECQGDFYKLGRDDFEAHFVKVDYICEGMILML